MLLSLACLFALAALLAVLVYFRGEAAQFYAWPASTWQAEALGLLLSLGGVALLFFLYRREPRGLLAAVVLGIAVRLGFALALLPGAVPFSDFSQVWEIATGVASGQTLLYKSFFPEWCNYIASVKLLVEWTGLSYNGLVLVASVCGCIAVVEVFLLTCILARDRNLGLLAASLYAWMPSQVVYGLVPTPDAVAMVFMLAATCLLALQLRGSVGLRRFFLLAAVSGLLIGFGSSFKPVGMVLAIAYAMALAFSASPTSRSGDGVGLRRGAVCSVLSVAIVAALGAGLPQLARLSSECVLGTEISHSAAASYLCVGLNTEGEGQIHLGSKSRYYNELRMAGASEEEAASSTRAMLAQDWSENAAALPRLFLKKVVWAWQDDLAPADFLEGRSVDASRLGGLGAALYGAASALAGPLSQGWYLAVMACAAAGAAGAARRGGGASYGMQMAALFILGFALLLLISEAQSRYKSNVLPFVVVFAALGLSALPGIGRTLPGRASASAPSYSPVARVGTKGDDPMTDKSVLFVVMPAYNEEENISTVLEEWYPVVERVDSTPEGRGSRLVVFDDGSSDGTLAAMRRFGEDHPLLVPMSKRNSGHGATVYEAYEYALGAGADWVFQTDTDGQTRPDEFWRLWDARRGCDMAAGVRASREDGFSRIAVAKSLKLVLLLTCRVAVPDANVPFRLMSTESLGKCLAFVPKGFNLTNVALSVAYLKLRKRVEWYPITFRERQGGSTRSISPVL